MRKIIVIGFLLSACSPNFPSTTVMITNLAGNSGGSGSIIRVSETESDVLTNGHVCNVVKNGGLVQSVDQTAFVTSYKISALHDLCVLKVATDLEHATSLSKWVPTPFDDAVVAGHPHLLPTIITEGHISGKRVIGVITGVRECSEAEKTDPTVGFLCQLVGKVPVIRSYEAVAISPTIQPGSSGSAVYTPQGRIQAVVFAGEGDFGYGYAVPFEFVYKFLTDEIKTLRPQYPDLTVRFGQPEPNKSSSLQDMRDKCKDAPNPAAAQFCKEMLRATNINDLIFRGSAK